MICDLLLIMLDKAAAGRAAVAHRPPPPELGQGSSMLSRDRMKSKGQEQIDGIGLTPAEGLAAFHDPFRGPL